MLFRHVWPLVDKFDAYAGIEMGDLAEAGVQSFGIQGTKESGVGHSISFENQAGAGGSGR